MVYMISYDIGTPDTNRQAVMNAIEALGTTKKFLTTTYLLSSNLSIYDVESAITKYLQGKDALIVCAIEKPVRGWLSKEDWNWISSHL